jgi:hypothetical protein
MAQIFHPSMNVIAKASILGGIIIIAGLAGIAGEWYRSPYLTNVHVARIQPVPFSHEHHVTGLGIDCRYCHVSVETSSFAGLPATKVCMTCHSQIWTNAPMLEPVRESWRTGQSIVWTRVHELPDFVFFNHSIHVQKGVGCAECHGRVDQMPLMWKENTLLMRWCIDCHEAPAARLRPRDQVFNMGFVHPRNETGMDLLNKYQVNQKQLTNCSVCHR